MMQLNDKGRRITFWILLAATFVLMMLLIPWLAGKTARPLWMIDFDLERVVNLLLMLFVVTLFVERAADVIITVWRDPGKAERKDSVERLSREVSRLSAAGAVPIPAVTNKLEEAEKDAAKFNSGTGRIAGMVTFLFGVAAALVGFRVLLPLVDQTSFKPLSGFQQGVFYWFDALVTGAVIGGGSEGIHQMMKAIISVSQKVRAKMGG
jgi:hypothetical protein